MHVLRISQTLSALQTPLIYHPIRDVKCLLNPLPKYGGKNALDTKVARIRSSLLPIQSNKISKMTLGASTLPPAMSRVCCSNCKKSSLQMLNGQQKRRSRLLYQKIRKVKLTNFQDHPLEALR